MSSNRLIRSGLLDSDKINKLSLSAADGFTHLLLVADDAGRCDARIPIVKNLLYPIRKITPQTVIKFIKEWQKQKLVVLYIVRGKAYIQILRWQRTRRTKKSKFPDAKGEFTINYIKVKTTDRNEMYVDSSMSEYWKGNIPTKKEGDIIMFDIDNADEEMKLNLLSVKVSKEQEDLKKYIEAIYKAYPKHAAHLQAEKSIEKAIKLLCKTKGISTGIAGKHLLEITLKFAKTEKANGKYCPLPATFFNQGRYNDDPVVWGKIIKNNNRKTLKNNELKIN